MQQAHGAGVTNIDVYSQLVELRKQPSFQWGPFHAGVDRSVYFHVRQAAGFPGFLVAINLGPSDAAVDLVSMVSRPFNLISGIGIAVVYL